MYAGVSGCEGAHRLQRLQPFVVAVELRLLLVDLHLHIGAGVGSGLGGGLGLGVLGVLWVLG